MSALSLQWVDDNFRRVYRSVVPRSLREKIYVFRSSPIKALLRPLPGTQAFSGYLSGWLDRRLQLDGYYWLFLLGVNNSGTTVITRFLETHPLIRGLPTEGQLLTDALSDPSALGVNRLWTQRSDVFRWLEDDDPGPSLWAKIDWVRHYARRPGILLEKSPPNTLRSRWLQRNFRPSRFLAVVRSPYAVCEGIRRRTGCTIEAAAKHWTVANECVFADMEHLGRCYWFRYEDFCDRPSEHLTKIQRFLDLALPFPTDGLRSVSAHSIEGRSTGIQNLNQKSMAGLSPEDIRQINSIAGPLSQRLGYDLSEVRP